MNKFEAEVEKIKDSLFFLSVKKEEKQQKFAQQLNEIYKNNLYNQLTGEIFDIHYSFIRKHKRNLYERQQQIYALIATAKKQNLFPIFLTLTVPSEYHPFLSGRNKFYKKNPKFKFNSIDEAIPYAYQKLKLIFVNFYKQIKKIDKNIKFIKIYEPHRSLIPHLHCLLFINSDHRDRIKKIFYNVMKNNNLQRVDFDESVVLDQIQNVVGYIMKYLFKTYLGQDDYQLRWMDGWRRQFKIRALETSRLPMSLEIYRNIYYSLQKETKKQIDEIIKDPNTPYSNFFEFFLDNSEVEIEIVDEDYKTISKKTYKGEAILQTKEE